MSSSIKIIKCTQADWKFVYDLLKENMFDYFQRHFPKGWSDKWFEKKWSTRRNQYSLILSGKTKVGFIDLEYKKTAAYLHEIQIKSKYQGRGIGRAVMKLLESIVVNKKFKQLRLHVFKDNPAIKFYLKLNYVINGTGHKGHSHLMVKKLKS